MIQVASAGSYALSGMSSLGYGQTWQDVTVSRSIGTTYYNTTGRPIVFQAKIANTTATNLSMTVNGSTVWGFINGVGGGILYALPPQVVPPGGSYSITAATSTLTTWFELR